MPKIYYSAQKDLFACWFDNSHFLTIGRNPREHEIESHIFYSNNAVEKYLEENGYKKL